MSQFKSHFKFILAAGGLVKNKKKQILMIYKNHTWDLPKGKVDVDEEYKDAAIREVEEETNVKCVIINNFTYSTYHLYKEEFNNNQLVFKQTYWFHMLASSRQVLKPQLSEGIIDVQWINARNLNNIYTYPSITDLMTYYFSLI